MLIIKNMLENESCVSLSIFKLNNYAKDRYIELKTKEEENSGELITKEDIKELMNKRVKSKKELEIISEYLKEHIDYFNKLSKNNAEKYLSVVSSISIRTFEKDQDICRYNEEGHNFYIVFNGKVEIKVPFVYTKNISLLDYTKILMELKKSDTSKFDRVYNKNKKNVNHKYDFLINHLKLKSAIMDSYVNVSIEEYHSQGIFEEGFSFGEMSILKKKRRTATITAKEETMIIDIPEDVFLNALKNDEEKKIINQIEYIKKNYSIFNDWTTSQFLKLFNYTSHCKFTYGDYIYKENEDADYIYFIKNGKFELYSYVSFNWINEYIQYIQNNSDYLITTIKSKKNLKESDIEYIISEAEKQEINSPFKEEYFKKFNEDNKIKKHYINNTKSIYSLKLMEDEVFSGYNLFKVLIRTVDSPVIVGIEEAIEAKKRFCFLKCTSKGEVDKIRRIDFLKILSMSSDNLQKNTLISFINERKKYFCQTIINSLKRSAVKFSEKVQYNYQKLLIDLNNFNKHNQLKPLSNDNLIESDNDKKRNNSNILLIQKMSAWNTDLEDKIGTRVKRAVDRKTLENCKNIGYKNEKKLLASKIFPSNIYLRNFYNINLNERLANYFRTFTINTEDKINYLHNKNIYSKNLLNTLSSYNSSSRKKYSLNNIKKKNSQKITIDTNINLPSTINSLSNSKDVYNKTESSNQ